VPPLTVFYFTSNEVLAEKIVLRVGFFLGFLAQGGAYMQLKLIVRTVDDIVIVDCSGRLVFGEESADLRDTVRMVITQSKRVILNLSGVTYIDSGGLGTLVALYTTARNNGGSIKLANLTQRVGDLLQVTKLVTIFDVYDSEEDALESFRKAA
jgi:anti-sigma B factor antagonist